MSKRNEQKHSIFAVSIRPMQKNNKKICMISDMHDAFDDRIYYKQALSMKKQGFDVVHIAVGDSNNAFISKEGIKIITFKRKLYFKNFILNKLYKVLFRKDVFQNIYKAALKEHADFYHVHDYKVVYVALKLKKAVPHSKIIYDVHDPLAVNIREKPFGSFKKLHAKYVEITEIKAAKKFDHIITTEENLAEYFRNAGIQNISIIYNFTTLNEEKTYVPLENRKYDLFYCGLISENRGIFQIIDAIEEIKKTKTNISLLIVGPIHTPGLSEIIKNCIQEKNLQSNITLKNAVPYKEIGQYYNMCKIGLGIFLPLPTYHIILQIKIFEYMIFGLPIIGSNFGHINDYIIKEQAGLTVNPLKPIEIAESVLSLLNNAKEMERLSKNGFKAAHNNYTWQHMEIKLSSLYNNL